MLKTLKRFIQLESSSACLLLSFTILALLLSNSPWHMVYNKLLNAFIGISILNIPFKTQFLHVINEGLMTLFFLLVGLEVKYELCYGALNSLSKACLPGIAAVGGMLVPAMIYAAINYHHPISLQGWAIPTATDIAFSLGILTLLGSRIPTTLKIFLMALAIFDDLAAIMVIAIFYTDNVSFVFLGWAGVCVGMLIIVNRLKVNKLFVYWALGIALWFCLLKAGIHPTLAGGILAFLIPLHNNHDNPSCRLKHRLHPWVAFGILPLFAFANAGVSFVSISFSELEMPVVLGVFGGLFLGKQIGVFGFCWLAVKYRWAQLPEKVQWRDLYAISILCGIGFTISLFIGTLAFGDYSSHLDSVKIAVLLASFVSAVLGGGLLALKKRIDCPRAPD